jgi:hypothetical protein
MRKLFVVIFAITLLIPLHAQDGKKRFDFSRKYFEIGVDTVIGFDNDLISANDIFKKNIVVDLDELGDKIDDDGLHINADIHTGFFINVRMQEKWGLGFYEGIDGGIYGNLPKSLFTLIAEGNIDTRSFSGTIKASGAVYESTGLSAFLQLKKWRFGIGPAMFVPLVYIPAKSGITYYIDTEEGIKLDAEGEIEIFTIDMDSLNPAGIFASGGFDLSVDAEYALFPFLNLGASISNIPLVAGELRNVNRYTLDQFYLDIGLNKGLDLPTPSFTSVSEACEKKVRRPLRFDAYAQYRPLSSNRDLLVLRGNVGFTADITEQTQYFNAGLEIQSHLLRNMLFISLATGYTESIWKHRVNLALNFRALELDLGAAFRSQDFVNSFQASGVDVVLGVRLGW